jgi:hypothetical protein
MVSLKANDLFVELSEKLHASGDLKLPDNASRSQKTTKFMNSATPELVTFVGYLGNQRSRGGITWVYLYLNWAMSECLLIEKDGIVRWSQIKDDDADWDKRDVLWVKADAQVIVAPGTDALEVQFLSGQFTRAGDFEAGPDGGTTAGATGVFCEARSVGCCKPRTTKRPRGG